MERVTQKQFKIQDDGEELSENYSQSPITKEQMTQTNSYFIPPLVNNKKRNNQKISENSSQKLSFQQQFDSKISLSPSKPNLLFNFEKRVSTDYSSLSLLRYKQSLPTIPNISEIYQREKKVLDIKCMNQFGFKTPHRVIDQMKILKSLPKLKYQEHLQIWNPSVSDVKQAEQKRIQGKFLDLILKNEKVTVICKLKTANPNLQKKLRKIYQPFKKLIEVGD